MPTMADRRRAFTLIELLVVVAIVAALAAMLMPVISMVKEAAVRSTCASQMRQVGMAGILYRGDSDGLFVPVYWNDPGWNTWSSWAYATTWDGRWQHMLQAYTETYKVFNCPASLKVPIWGRRGEVLDAAEGSYKRGAARGGGLPGWPTCLTAYNSANWGRAGTWSNPGPMNEVKAESYLKSVLATARIDRCPVFFDGMWQNDGTNHLQNQWGVYFPHRALRANMIFADGHAESRVKADVTSYNPAVQVRD
ncbi:MAG: prepilin-type N-terminal cleavage/methylation domain-containing protein [Planctomycetes bacterium]|nr:prepilin-type N-terminal cleavage/methylation domain-containing protein [Planctomycetota bacterium]